METPSGFRELRHTADWEIEVWAHDLAGLFEQAALGMYALSGTQLRAQPRHTRTLALAAPDPESLLVRFLAELLYLGEQDGLGFDTFDLRLDGDRLQAHLSGAPIDIQSKEIKAVTYHNLAVRRTSRGLEVRIVFDV